MTKTKGLLLLIIILLVSNFVAWYMLFSGRSRKTNRKEQTREFLKKDIGFNDRQVKAFDSLSGIFRENLRTEMEKTRVKKLSAMKSVAEKGFSDSAIQEGAREMAASQHNLEVMMLKQTANIRNICTPAQLPAFDAKWEKMFQKKPGKKRSGR